MADGATGVDVSWLRHSHKGTLLHLHYPPAISQTFGSCATLEYRTTTCRGIDHLYDYVPPTALTSSVADQAQRTKAAPPSGIPDDPPPPKSAASSIPPNDSQGAADENKPIPQVSTNPVNGTLDAPETHQAAAGAHVKHHAIKRPHLRSKTSNSSIEKMPEEGKPEVSSTPERAPASQRSPGGRRNSWITNLSSKFGSSPVSTPTNANRDSVNAPKQTGISPKVEKTNPFDNTTQQMVPREDTTQPYVPAPPKTQNTSFLSSALRRLSSGSAGLGKLTGTGTTAQRRVMNLDPNRERCKVPELEKAKLKRVSFCVDVEIAGYARTDENEENGQQAPTRLPSLHILEREAANKKKRDTKDAKMKDAGEGAALKNSERTTQEKETDGVIQANNEVVGTSKDPKPEGEIVDGELDTNASTIEAQGTKKKEKKKRSEAERKERKEKKRRLAEADGSVPLELTRNDDDDSSESATTPPDPSAPESGKPQTKPTIDPLRIYRRCAQLRETPALKKILDQISVPSSTLSESPGTVAVLDLTGVWMQYTDIVTLGDWLAIVPVRKLILENCGLTDDSVKVILSGLLSCKTPEQAKHNKKLAKKGGIHGQELLCVVERVSLKDNSKITRAGWEHIGLFMHMSKSLRAIDLSGIPFGRKKGIGASSDAGDNLCSLISKGLAERFGGNKLEELIMSQCSLSTNNVANLVDGAIACGLRRLGLAENDLSPDSLEHIVRFMKSGVCEGLDLGGNPQFHSQMDMLNEAIDNENPLVALSLAACDLETSDLSNLFRNLVKLPNFRFIDLSHNRSLFASQPNALSLFRKYLPQLSLLKRIHLCDVDLSADDAIALAEVLPECGTLAHFNMLENRPIAALAEAKDSVSQEEACAVYASLMTAVRCSHSIVAIDIEVPSADSSEVVKAIASQVVAYSLRNLERFPLTEGEQPSQAASSDLSKSAPEVLLHLVGHMEGYEKNYDNDNEPAPDEDYYISATGVVKALGVCLGTADQASRGVSRDISPAASGTATPRRSSKPLIQKKPKDMSKELLESARKIRIRLRPALVKEDRLGNDMNYREYKPLNKCSLFTNAQCRSSSIPGHYIRANNSTFRR